MGVTTEDITGATMEDIMGVTTEVTTEALAVASVEGSDTGALEVSPYAKDMAVLFIMVILCMYTMEE